MVLPILSNNPIETPLLFMSALLLPQWKKDIEKSRKYSRRGILDVVILLIFLIVIFYGVFLRNTDHSIAGSIIIGLIIMFINTWFLRHQVR